MGVLHSRKPDAKTAVDPATERAVSGNARVERDRPRDGWHCAGDVIGSKYCLTRVLGQGGMGAVWLARNTTLDVEVAVKLIRREKATAAASARLLQEAQLAARLSHPSIVRIFDFGATDAGEPFIVMELLRGESLAQHIERKGRMPPVRAVQVLLPVVSGLQAAHSKGIVHRDLKPDNIFLAEEPTGTTPKVVDFGIAKLQSGPARGSLTQTGAVLGSPDYMSPEQARGRGQIDERTDVWGLSVVLYECVTGLAPFQGYNYNALLSAIIEDDPTPIGELGVREAGLWTIVQRGMAKRPEDRYQSARELGRALVEWLQSKDVTTDITGAALAADWGCNRRPLSEPLTSAALRAAGIRDRPTDPAPSDEPTSAHAAIPPPPRMPASEPQAVADESPPAEVAAPAMPSAQTQSRASRTARRTVALVAVALLAASALAGLRVGSVAPPTARALPTGSATALSASATGSAPSNAPSALPAAATPSASTSTITETTSAPPAPSVIPGRRRKPGTMPLPARPNF